MPAAYAPLRAPAGTWSVTVTHAYFPASSRTWSGPKLTHDAGTGTAPGSSDGERSGTADRARVSGPLPAFTTCTPVVPGGPPSPYRPPLASW